MARKRRYEELVLSQRSMDLVDLVYKISGEWPGVEAFRLTDQVRRAVISVPANVAEGHGRTGKNEFLHHLSIAYGSLMETETLISISSRQRYTSEPAYELVMDLADEVGRLLRGMMASLRQARS